MIAHKLLSMLKCRDIPDRERARLTVLHAVSTLQPYCVIREVLAFDFDLSALSKPQSAFSLQGNGMRQRLVSYIGRIYKTLSQLIHDRFIHLIRG